MNLKNFQPYTKNLPLYVTIIVAVLNVLLQTKVVKLGSPTIVTVNSLLVAIGLGALHINVT